MEDVEDMGLGSTMVDGGLCHTSQVDDNFSLRPRVSSGQGILRVEIIC